MKKWKCVHNFYGSLGFYDHCNLHAVLNRLQTSLFNKTTETLPIVKLVSHIRKLWRKKSWNGYTGIPTADHISEYSQTKLRFKTQCQIQYLGGICWLGNQICQKFVERFVKDTLKELLLLLMLYSLSDYNPDLLYSIIDKLSLVQNKK